jgi:nucleolar protein 14
VRVYEARRGAETEPRQRYLQLSMVKGSQLTQLKSALSEAGLSRKSQSKTSGKKRKRYPVVTTSEKDKDKAAKKLHEIHERLNPFDVKITHLKHDVGGRKLKGVTGRPGLSKQAGIEQVCHVRFG